MPEDDKKKKHPMLNFKDLFADVKKLDEIVFVEKYGIDKNKGKMILDGLWLEQLSQFDKEIQEYYKDYSFVNNFDKEIKEVEIFEPGLHNGHVFTESDITKILNNTKKAQSEENLQIPIKLGHSEEQGVAKTLFGEDTKGMPALGWVKNIKKKGNKLVADFVDIPDKLFNLLGQKSYKAKSIELWEKFINKEGKNLGSVLTGVALLGAEIPAVTSLATDLFDKSEKANVYSSVSENKKGEIKMTDENKDVVGQDPAKDDKPVAPKDDAVKKDEVKEVAKEDVKENKREFELKNFTSEKQVENKLIELKKEADKGNIAIKELAEFKKDSVKKFDEVFLEKMGEKGKVLPFQSEMLKPVLCAMDDKEEVKYFEKSFDSKEEAEPIEKKATVKKLFCEFIESLPDQVKLKEFSKAVGKTVKKDLTEMAKEYSAKNKISFEEAIPLVVKEHPELEDQL